MFGWPWWVWAIVGGSYSSMLLANVAWASPQSSMQEGPRPLQADQLLWSFTPWAGFDGFWTDRGRTLLHLAGPGMDLTFYR